MGINNEYLAELTQFKYYHRMNTRSFNHAGLLSFLFFSTQTAVFYDCPETIVLFI